MIRRPTLLVLVLLLLAPVGAAGSFVFPDPPPPEEYGNVLIGRTSAASGMKPATFSHWIHRQKHTCRVCHFELQFNFEANTTEITEAANRAGMFCGACHDGKQLFGHEKPEDCQRCHSGDLRQGSEKFGPLWRLPEARYGNRIDWDAALADAKIKPAHQLTIEPASEGGFSNTLLLEAEWTGVSGAIVPHGRHAKWLDCNDCHPYIFNIKKKFTEGLRMANINQGQFCGVCHGKVAFPLTDCVRCHTGMKAAPSFKEPVSR